jgi:hypothetical protein
MTSTPHTNCTHPATKAARAACRRQRAAASTANREALAAILTSFYDNSGDSEEIAAKIDLLAARTGDEALRTAARGYYDGSLTIEEMIYTAAQSNL